MACCSSAEAPCADGEGHRAGAVLWKAARVAELQIHAGGRRQGRVRDLQVVIILLIIIILCFTAYFVLVNDNFQGDAKEILKIS